MTLTRGQRVSVSDLGASDVLHVGLGCVPPRFEVVVAGLEADETLVDRAFLLSRHQPASFEGSVALGAGEGGDMASLTVHLTRVPSSVETLRIALVSDGPASADDLRDAWLRVLADGRETARWSFTGSELSGERAIIVADLYRRNGWRMVLHGTGYRAGLRAFLERIDGGSRLPGAPEAPTTTAPPPPRTPEAPTAPFPPPPGAAPTPPPLPSAPSPSPPSPPPPVAPGPAAPGPAGRGAGRPPAPSGPPRPESRGGGTLRTGLSWRERIFSVPVAKALASPSGLGLAAGGAVAGGAGAGVLVGSGAIAAGALGLGALAWLGRGAAAVPRQRGEKINPFALREPWRSFVRDALAAHDTFAQLVRRTPEGPLRDRLADIAERLEAGLRESWRIASRGETLVEARRAIDDAAVRAELATLQAIGTTGDPDARARLAEALQSQIDAADRLDRIIDQTYDQLRLMDARMDNAVTRALEISVSATDSAAYGHLGAEVDGLVDDLEALRQGLEEIRNVDPGTSPRPG